MNLSILPPSICDCSWKKRWTMSPVLDDGSIGLGKSAVKLYGRSVSTTVGLFGLFGSVRNRVSMAPLIRGGGGFCNVAGFLVIGLIDASLLSGWPVMRSIWLREVAEALLRPFAPGNSPY